MSEIQCRKCTSPYCDGCNVFILSNMLQHGKLDSLMTANRSIDYHADVVGVVRCRDCIRADEYGHCEMQNFWGTRDDYCSRGVRRCD